MELLSLLALSYIIYLKLIIYLLSCAKNAFTVNKTFEKKKKKVLPLDVSYRDLQEAFSMQIEE